MLEGYGPLGGSLNPVGPVPVMMETLAGIYLVPPLNRARESACRAACMNNTRQLMLALRRYAMDHNDNYPDSFGDLLKKGYITTTKVFFCPSSGHSIPADFPTDFKDADLAELRKIDELSDYLMVPYATASFPPSFVVVYEKDNHRGEGRNLGFNDGHVDWQTGEELRETITRQISEAKKMGWPQEYVDKMVSSLEVILEQTNP